eukprot:COSAG02_NODE_811_length_16911_cov_343.583095_9_plen_64_part_00
MRPAGGGAGGAAANGAWPSTCLPLAVASIADTSSRREGVTIVPKCRSQRQPRAARARVRMPII